MSIVGDLTQQIVGDLYSVKTIVTGLENPHTYEPSSGEITKIATCDLFVLMGVPGLESWVDDVLDSYPTLTTVKACNLSSMMEYDPVIKVKNPHVWMNPLIAQEMIERIYNKIITVDPENTETYQSNKETYLLKLNGLYNRVLGNKTFFQGIKVVIHHPSFKYLFDLLDIERIAVIEEHEGEEPSVEHISKIVGIMKEQNVKLIVNQPQLDENTVIQIARDTGAQIAELSPSLGIEDQNGQIIEHYIDLIDFNLWALANPHDPPSKGKNDLFVWIGIGLTLIATSTAIFVLIVRLHARIFNK
ncbi:MAG: metal ABC transporter substrate-binding protein [Promethearchaeota archaeon]